MLWLLEEDADTVTAKPLRDIDEEGQRDWKQRLERNKKDSEDG
jgi:hypothetical protein